MTDYANFRQRLDAVLRTRDVQRVRAFLIAEQQWSEDTPADPEFAMWVMIAGSPALRNLHDEARAWLLAHGHEEEARIFQTRDKVQAQSKKPTGKPGSRRGPTKPGNGNQM
jgi:hypothetical protein